MTWEAFSELNRKIWSEKAGRELTEAEVESMVLDFYSVLDAVRVLHEDFPNLRFGQILENARTRENTSCPMFYMSNRELAACVRRFHRNLLAEKKP